jgi:anti-sigma B factor antagonist
VIEIGRTRQVDGVAVVDVAGRATLGQGYGRLPRTVKNIVDAGQKRILLNLGGVTYVDSYGLNDLVSSYVSATDRGAELKLVNVPERVRYVLQLTKLDSVFDTFEEEAAAVLSFSE